MKSYDLIEIGRRCGIKFIIIFLMSMCCVQVDARIRIYVNSQADFDALSRTVVSAINKGEKDIYIIMRPHAEFVAKENHVFLGHVIAPMVNVFIKGNGSVLLPQGKEYRDGDSYTGSFSYDNSLMFGREDVPLWSYCKDAQGLIEIIDKKTCRLKVNTRYAGNIEIDNSYVMIPEWCQTDVYKITKVEGEYIYFAVNGNKKSYNNGYLVNDDYNYGGQGIRYKLCNMGESGVFFIQNGFVALPHNVKYVREGQIHNFITLQSSEFNSVTISGLEFRGNSYANSKSAIFICDTRSDHIIIKKCIFRGLHSTAISIESTANVTVDNNVFKDCHYYGVSSDNNSKNAVITNNTFESMGKRMQCSFCITCRGEDYYVARNTLKDFGYGGIGVGVWHGHEKPCPSIGIVEYNELSYSKDYLANIKEKCIMDGGAIYLWTQNDRAIIRNNYIHDISGVKDNRGIFCDDGARNIIVENNVITNILNSYCIDSRRVSSMESKIGPTNVNNVITGNIVDGQIRFIGREGGNNNCEYRTNFFLAATRKKSPNMIVNNVTVTGGDVVLEYSGKKRGRVGVSKTSYKELKKTPNWNALKVFVVRKDK